MCQVPTCIYLSNYQTHLLHGHDQTRTFKSPEGDVNNTWFKKRNFPYTHGYEYTTYRAT